MAYVPNSGSVVAFQGGTTITSVVSTVPSSVLVGASIYGLAPVNVTNTNVPIAGSVVAFQSSYSNLQVAASIVGTVPVTGSFAVSSASVVQQGTWNTSITSTAPSSVLVGASIFGALPGGNAVIGAVAASISGSVTVTGLQGASVSGTVNIAGTPSISGTVAATEQGTWINSVISGSPSSMLVGTYAQRNDNVASFLGGNLTWNPFATDSAGRTLTKPFSPEESRLDIATSVVSGSVTALFASVTGLRNYVSDIHIANTGSVATLVTFKDGSTSILGYTIAPAGGGSNIINMSFPMRTAPAQDFCFVAGTAASVLYVTARGFKAP